MSEQDLTGSKRFGSYLRRLREGRKLSLDAVVEMSTEFPEKLTKSHLSRMENGQALPSFPRLYALSRIYGVPTSSLAEQFELDLELELQPPDLAGLTDLEVLEQSRKLILAGRYSEAIGLCLAAFERAVQEGRAASEHATELRLHVIDCMIHRGHFLMAKDESEELLSSLGLSPVQRLKATHCFVISCKWLKRYPIAMMALEGLESELDSPHALPRHKADIVMERGAVLEAMGEGRAASLAFKRASELYEELLEHYEACRARMNLAQTLMNLQELDEARPVLLAANKEAETNGYDRLLALGLSHLALLAYRRGAFDEAEGYALRSNALARPRDYLRLVFRNCFYLWRIAIHRGDTTAARLNEKTLRTYVGRIDDALPEAQQFKAYLVGGVA